MYFLILCVLLQLSSVLAVVVEKNGTYRNVESSLVRRKRLTGGVDAPGNEGAIVGSLQRKADRTHLCGVSLITSKYGITSCSCVNLGIQTEADLPQSGNFVVVAGDKKFDTKNEAHIRVVKSFWMGEKCFMDEETGFWKFGLGYFELAKAFPDKGGPEFASGMPKTQAEYEKSLKTYNEDAKFAQGSTTDYCYTYGWGAKKYDEKTGDPTEFPPSMNKRAMQFITLNDCQDRLCSNGFCNFNIEKAGAVCLGVPDNSNGGLCKGDSGNPLICGKNFLGVGEEAPDCGKILRLAIFYKLDISVIQSLKSGVVPGPFTHTTTIHFVLIILPFVKYVIL